MALENATYINGLVPTNPLSTDTVAQADDHIRLIKQALKATFPNITGPVTQSQSQLNSPIPSGFIGMWSGSIATIPVGWLLCDGNNGTPNLTDKFVIGAGGAYAVGASGGSSTQTLTVGNLPAHTHSGISDSGGAHTHSITDPGHAHSYTAAGGQNNVYPGNNGGAYPYGSTTGGATTGITINSGGAHTHSFTTNSTGSGNSFSILPPYYALAFIMKA
jgi:microcystin-dependent protein